MKKISLRTITLLIAFTMLGTACLSGNNSEVVKAAQITELSGTTSYTINSSRSVDVSDKNNTFDGEQVDTADEDYDIVGWWDWAKKLWNNVIRPAAVWVWDHRYELLGLWDYLF
ncbi:MAG TPA: hypothetical protein VKO43_03085 [Candidatus Krumholzibacteriaceae bacterium]|nr:hypothetical protein [Candidatus Krumholzibacteriaceae bacterium]